MRVVVHVPLLSLMHLQPGDVFLLKPWGDPRPFVVESRDLAAGTATLRTLTLWGRGWRRSRRHTTEGCIALVLVAAAIILWLRGWPS